MRVASIVLALWLIVGAIAGAQRHYYSRADPSCSRVADIVLTIVAGPLNYVGVNPRADCHIPQPSK